MATPYFNERTASPITDGVHPLSTPSSPAVAPRNNALQSRINSVLSTSYADLEIRESLSILDKRDIKNTPFTRRNLRLDAQQELIECNGEIVQDFGKVAEQLKRIGSAIANLNNTCAELRKHVGAAERETQPMLDEARGALDARREVEGKQQLLQAFNAHFLVSDADLMILTSTNEPVDDGFFRVLARVKKIHLDSQVLLASSNQRLGLEILEQSSRQLNSAFQKLYRWIQREFQSLDLENPQLSGAIRRALRVLAERPTLFQNCLDFFAEAREHILTNSFYAALTGTVTDQSNGAAQGKAIELSAHDPLRYISDMLAWAHAATVSEREALEALFISDGDELAKGIQAGIESDPWSRHRSVDHDSDEDEATATPIFNGREALNQLVDRDLAGVFRLLKQRTEQVVQSLEDATLAYKIANLITFYAGIFTSLLGASSSLLGQLRPLAETAMRSFRAITRDHVASLQADLAFSPDDLAAPEFLIEALENLAVLMKSYDISIVSANHEEKVKGFQPILQEALDPFLGGCENITQRLRSPSDHIFALNCLVATKETLATYDFTDRTDELQPKIEGHEGQLTNAMHAWFLKSSGLDYLVDNVHTSDDLASSYNDPSQLFKIAQQLDAFLPTATEDARAVVEQLRDRRLARRVIERAAEEFCGDFEGLEELLVRADEVRAGQVNGGAEEGDGEVWLRDVLARTGDEIRVLLS